MLNSFLKHGIIVGVVTFLLSSMLITSELSNVRYIVSAPEDYELSVMFIATHVGALVLALIAAVISGLLIWGIAKKRHMLLVPWLVFSFLALVILTFTVFYDTLTKDSNHLDDYLFCIIVVGFGVIVIYPIYILYIEIHYDNMFNSPGTELKL